MDVPVRITYHQQRSSTARIRDGEIVLRISSFAPRREQERHIEELLKTMQKKLPKQSKKVALSLRSVFAEGEVLLSTGACYQIRTKQGNVSKYKVEKLSSTLILIWPSSELEFDETQAEQALWKFLAKDQIKAVEQRLRDLRQDWIEENFRKVRWRMVSSRWGSCDKRQGIIMLSVKLLLVEPRLLDYVCVHELAHLKYADHSDLFWDLVAQKMPDWKIQRKKLRGYE
ncbi:MAG: DUF45 domain-containing protein [bacterium]|nr:DUF45 domain-containing protein [bacterium]